MEAKKGEGKVDISGLGMKKSLGKSQNLQKSYLAPIRMLSAVVKMV